RRFSISALNAALKRRSSTVPPRCNVRNLDQGQRQRTGVSAPHQAGLMRDAGILRLRLRIRKANPHASLRMTAWLEPTQRLQPFLNLCALRGAEAPLFHGAAPVRGCNVRNLD